MAPDQEITAPVNHGEMNQPSNGRVKKFEETPVHP